MSLRFESRELPPYAEYVEARDLEIGGVYFRVSFLGDDGSVPEMIPLVFVGRNLERGDEVEGCRLYFQNANSYLAGIRYDDGIDFESPEAEEPEAVPFAAAWFETTLEGGCTGVFEFEKALECLMRRSSSCKEKI